MAACLLATQHSFVLAQMEIWSTQLHVFFISTPSSLLHYREISCVLNITNHKQKDDHYQIWTCRKEQKITHQLMSYHRPEEMPVSKVHVHFLLELIKVALRQNPAVPVGLHLGWQNLTWEHYGIQQLTFKINFISAMSKVETKFTIEILEVCRQMQHSWQVD